MFEGFSPRTIDFMWNIRFNNRKDWFEEHKADYQNDLLAPMKELGNATLALMAEKHSKHGFSVKVSRIYKDARRVRDGEPYKDHLWFTILAPTEDAMTSAVFWFELKPDEWTCGLGYYMAKPITVAKFRARLDRDPQSFEKLISPFEKQSDFVLEGDEYAKKKPAPSPKTEEWYNKKSFSMIHIRKNGDEIFSPDLARWLADKFETLMPLYDYLVMLENDPEPKDTK